MKAIVAVHPEDLDVVVQPGVTRKELNEYLRSEPPSPEGQPPRSVCDVTFATGRAAVARILARLAAVRQQLPALSHRRL